MVRLALEQGRKVTAYSRSARKMDGDDPNLRFAQGDIMDADSVRAAIAGKDASRVALGSNGLRDKTTLTVSAQNVMNGMTQQNVDRLVILSAAGIGES